MLFPPYCNAAGFKFVFQIIYSFVSIQTLNMPCTHFKAPNLPGRKFGLLFYPVKNYSIILSTLPTSSTIENLENLSE
jgi:hypothetical protein